MKKYQTLKHEIYDLDALPLDQQSIYKAVWDFYQQEPDGDTFTAFWLAQIRSATVAINSQRYYGNAYFQNLRGYGCPISDQPGLYASQRLP